MRAPVIKIVFLSLLALLLGATVQAYVISDSETISLAPTDWGQSIYLEKYHGGIAHLQSIVIELQATGVGDVWVENLASTAEEIQLSWVATVTMKKNGSTLLTASPSFSDTKTWAAYDGNWDWDGTSGGKSIGITDTQTSSTTLTSGFSEYVGAGTFQLDILADAFSLTSGSGNVASYYETLAGATATVTYTATPEPGSLVALFAGCVGLAGYRMRRRSG